MLLAVLMIFYSLYFTVEHSLPKEMKPHPVFDGLVGFADGLLGGATSLSGVLPTMLCAMQPWTKMETSAVLRPCNIVVLGIALNNPRLKARGFLTRCRLSRNRQRF